MISSQLALQQSSRMFIKYFQLGFNLNKLAFHYKKNLTWIQTKISEQLKNLLIDLQGDLLRTKKITATVFMNVVSSDVQKKMLQIHKILDQRSSDQLLHFYRSRLVEYNIHMPHHLETVYPVSLESRISIYRQFVQFVKNQYLATQENKNPNTLMDLVKAGFVCDKGQIFEQRILDLIYVLYQKNNGNLQSICQQLQSRGLKNTKYDKNILGFKLANLKLLGLYRAYQSTSSLMDGKILNWNKFIKCYGDIFVNWSIGDQKKLLQIAITSNASIEDIKYITLKMGKQSAEKQKWALEYRKGVESKPQPLLKDNDGPKMQNRELLARRIAQCVELARREQLQPYERLSLSIKDEIKRKLANKAIRNSRQ